MLSECEIRSSWAEEAKRIIDTGEFEKAASYLKNAANILSSSVPHDAVVLPVTPEELRMICDATVRLTELRQKGCPHLCVENTAPTIFHKLLTRLHVFKSGVMCWFGDEDKAFSK